MQEAPRMPPLPGIKTVLDGERYIEKVNELDTDGADLRMQSRLVGVHKVSGVFARLTVVAPLPSSVHVMCFAAGQRRVHRVGDAADRS